MRVPKHPWMPIRNVGNCLLLEVPNGWTLDWRDGDDARPIRAPLRFADGQTATIPVGLGEIRFMPKVLKGAVDYWERWPSKQEAV